MCVLIASFIYWAFSQVHSEVGGQIQKILKLLAFNLRNDDVFFPIEAVFWLPLKIICYGLLNRLKPLAEDCLEALKGLLI